MTVTIGRRELLAALCSAAAAWPLAARAQQAGKTPRVGYIRAGTPHNDPFREEFVRGMRDLGYVEGRNVAYEFRHYGDDVESIPSLIGDLLRAKVDIIVVGGTAAIRAAQSATQSIPIVMGAAADPLESGVRPIRWKRATSSGLHRIRLAPTAARSQVASWPSVPRFTFLMFLPIPIIPDGSRRTGANSAACSAYR